MEFYIVSKKTLELIANAIRGKTGRNKKIIFPEGFINEIRSIVSNADFWDGNYEITPSIISQNLDTRGKTMRDDLLINKIPYYEVSNNSFGRTVYIGGSLNGE